MVTTGSVFVGRQGEMAALKAALDEVLSGKGRLVMLVGEPGIGKTRTAQELAAAAGQRGAHVLWGRCYEQAGAPPYWPWVQSLRSYVQQRDADQLRSESLCQKRRILLSRAMSTTCRDLLRWRHE